MGAQQDRHSKIGWKQLYTRLTCAPTLKSGGFFYPSIKNSGANSSGAIQATHGVSISQEGFVAQRRPGKAEKSVPAGLPQVGFSPHCRKPALNYAGQELHDADKQFEAIFTASLPGGVGGRLASNKHFNLQAVLRGILRRLIQNSSSEYG